MTTRRMLFACMVFALGGACTSERLAEPSELPREDALDDPQGTACVGSIVRVELAGKESGDRNRRLTFYVFDDGDEDSIFVGTRYGMWSQGEFDLSIDGKVVFTGTVPYLLYGGVMLPMGAVLDGRPRSTNRIRITRIAGVFK